MNYYMPCYSKNNKIKCGYCSTVEEADKYLLKKHEEGYLTTLQYCSPFLPLFFNQVRNEIKTKKLMEKFKFDC